MPAVVSEVVDMALETEAKMKKKSSSRSRVKLSDVEPAVKSFKEFVEAVTRRLKLQEEE